MDQTYSAMPIPKPLLIIALVIISGCSQHKTQSPAAPANMRYCDSYFVYNMCAEDQNGDGIVDYLYFEDSREIFMLSPDLPASKINGLGTHRCVQEMDKAMQRASSRLLLIDEHTSQLQRTRVKSALFTNYIRYLGRINACSRAKPNASSDHTVTDHTATEDSFGDEDYEEF